MKSYSLLIGARNKRGRFRRKDEKLLEKITARHFPAGFTILDASGAWYDATRTTFRKEEARQVLICTSSQGKLRAWSRELGEALRQKEVLVIEMGTVRRFRLASRRPAT
ncbi:MAG TPA: DUF3574 domain-containing protein [Opitutaceae bacterium]|nr:DUF3574 domain-containing protein [Opitutaceae bacterium]